MRKESLVNKRAIIRARIGGKAMGNFMHHHLNSLHVYCRLVEVIPKSLARRVAVYWGKTSLYGLIYRST